MALTLTMVVAAAALYWAGFLAPKQALSYQARLGFFVLLGLAAFTGYFAWREHRAIEELAVLIDPVPEITDAKYLPTAGEMRAIADVMAAIPGRGRLGTTQQDRKTLARKIETLRTRYWLVDTALSPGAVRAFYREGHRKRFELAGDGDFGLVLRRDGERMIIFVQEQRGTTSVLYAWETPD